MNDPINPFENNLEDTLETTEEEEEDEFTMDIQFDDMTPDYINKDEFYYYEPNLFAKGFNLLMRYVLEYHKYGDIILEKIRTAVAIKPEMLDESNADGWNALMIACRNSNTFSHVKVVKLLIKLGCNMSDTGKHRCPLVIACRYSKTDSNLDTVKLLLQYAYSPNTYINGSRENCLAIPIHWPETCDISIIKLLMQYGAKIDSLDRTEHTVLMHAVKKNCYYIVNELLNYDCDMYRINKRQQTVFTMCKNEKIMKLLTNEERNRNTLYYICCKYVKNNKRKIFNTLVKATTNKDVYNKLECMKGLFTFCKIKKIRFHKKLIYQQS